MTNPAAARSVFEDSADDDDDVDADFVPLVRLRADVGQEGTTWRPPRELRPGLNEPTIACEYGHPSQPSTLAWCWFVVDCETTRSAAWWRQRVPAGVDFRLALYPDGVDSAHGIRSRRELVVVPASAQAPDGVIVEPSPAVVVQTPIGVFLATLSTIKRTDGHPFYLVSPVSWAKANPQSPAPAPVRRRG